MSSNIGSVMGGANNNTVHYEPASEHQLPSKELRVDREIALAAVQHNNGPLLEFLSEELRNIRNNREIVRAAIIVAGNIFAELEALEHARPRNLSELIKGG